MSEDMIECGNKIIVGVEKVSCNEVILICDDELNADYGNFIMSDKQFKHGPVTMFQMQKQKEIKELQKHIKELQKHVDRRKKNWKKRCKIIQTLRVIVK